MKTRASTSTRPTERYSSPGDSRVSARASFNLPHNIGCDADGWVYVADRENHRVQVFHGSGKFETQWHNVHRPSGLFTAPGREPLCYVGEAGPTFAFSRGAPNLGPRISILSARGRSTRSSRKRADGGVEPGKFISPHGLTVDSHGDIYVAEVSVTGWGNVYGPDVPRPDHYRSLQKLVKVSSCTRTASEAW